MIDADFFLDNKSRIMIPYKGWHIVNSDGTQEKDNLILDVEGPFKIIPDPLSSGNWHTLNNLIDANGCKMLSKGVRKITYYEEGYYLLEDNNEDELMNKGVGTINLNEYVSKMNVLLSDGRFLFNEWVYEVVPCFGYFRVKYNRRGGWSWVTLMGERFEIHNLKFNCLLAYANEKCSIRTSFDNKLTNDYTSAMWADEGMWNVNLLRNGEKTTFLYGQGGEIISYAQSILIKPNIIVLLESNNIWYSFDSLGRLVECFYWCTSA